MRTNEISFRIRYSETDQMGVVYHGNYAQYLELARVEWLRSLGISYKSMEEGGIMLPVISLSINFLKPALYDDLITVKVILNKKPAVRIEFDYEIINEAGELLATANTVLVFMDMKRKRPTKCPQVLLDKLKY
ncbi:MULTISPECIES: acyl-CoA thioesterase [Maribacter]|mgnify:FL=1|uniref:Acyl-CoA thioester hydrolase n=1 Tax=Maribacter stanieri TaxID=440514 RepID=A0A1I6J6M0_9FLAO|nr:MULTISPECIES: thioesterase family protein [Maribacter]SFR74605.1 acyl-CoA thioester hydrolase [Maribacter stanieri]|tara:strand:+ start:7413 stop:7811 length:399 start_codon:yes stop_codon:yes gene_type:complete